MSSIKQSQCFLFPPHLDVGGGRAAAMDCGAGAKDSGIGVVGFRE